MMKTPIVTKIHFMTICKEWKWYILCKIFKKMLVQIIAPYILSCSIITHSSSGCDRITDTGLRKRGVFDLQMEGVDHHVGNGMASEVPGSMSHGVYSRSRKKSVHRYSASSFFLLNLWSRPLKWYSLHFPSYVILDPVKYISFISCPTSRQRN